LHYEILLRPVGEKEREREKEKDLKNSRQKNERIKERIKKVTSVPSSNTLSLSSSSSFSLLPTNKVA